MKTYLGESSFGHDELPAVGVLLANLGTPQAPTPKALRKYLRQFLSDPRVIELSRPVWWLILNAFVLTRRPYPVAKLYQQIWTDEGSPLLVITRRQGAGLEERLRAAVGNPLHVAVAMRYGRPSIADGLDELRRKGCRRILVLPAYPQYSATTTASTFDAVFEELGNYRWVPELRTIHEYCGEPEYIQALAASIRELWQREGEPEKLLLSYHGIPKRYFLGGDPYHCHCHRTTRLVAEELGLPEDRVVTAFQSQFGREEWIRPATDKTIEALARSGVRHLDVVCPGFSADCLETLEEIDEQNREIFTHAGGERFRYIPALNDRPDHLDTLAAITLRHLQGWTVPPEAWDQEAEEERVAGCRHLAEALAARTVPADGGYGAP